MGFSFSWTNQPTREEWFTDLQKNWCLGGVKPIVFYNEEYNLWYFIHAVFNNIVGFGYNPEKKVLIAFSTAELAKRFFPMLPPCKHTYMILPIIHVGKDLFIKALKNPNTFVQVSSTVPELYTDAPHEDNSNDSDMSGDYNNLFNIDPKNVVLDLQTEAVEFESIVQDAIPFNNALEVIALPTDQDNEPQSSGGGLKTVLKWGVGLYLVSRILK